MCSTSLRQTLILYALCSVYVCPQGGAIYFSSGRIHMLVSYLVDCVLSENIAYSGWGGAFYGVDSPYSHFSMQSSSFVGNRAYSSYFTQSHGGALMITSNINVNISDCTFANNSALPYLDVVPLTYRCCLQ